MLAKSATGGDVEAVGEEGYAQYLVLRPGGQYLHVSGLDGLSHAVGENFGDRIPIPESARGDSGVRPGLWRG